MAEYRRFVREWETTNRGAWTDADRLGGFALAVRRSTFEALGGFDESASLGGLEDDELCRRMRAAALRLVIVHDSFVHRDGHATAEGAGVDWYAVQQDKLNRTPTRPGPLLSACMIVKDEADQLPDCLASLREVVDEVVVYDTGSTDNTVEVARAADAIVIEGYWDDDFARARNAALAHCQGEWVLHIDADEIVEADARGLRGTLDRARTVDAFAVEIYNLIGDGVQPGYTHRAFRLFRKARCHWEGHLHEQICLRPELKGTLEAARATGFRLVHSGYLAEAIAGRDKLARNLRVAEAGTKPGGAMMAGNPALAELNLARALAASDEHEQAVAHFSSALDELVAPSARRAALMFGTQSLLNVGRYDEAVAWAGRLGDESDQPGMAHFLEAQARRKLGQPNQAIELLEVLDELTTEDGFKPPAGAIEIELAGALLEAGRPDEAADEMIKLVERYADTSNVAAAHEAFRRAGRPLQELAAVIPESRLLPVAGVLVNLEPTDADATAEALWARFGSRPPLLAAAIRFAPRLAAERASAWSARLRAIGMSADCPLCARAASSAVDPPERVRAAALAFAAFEDASALDLARRAAAFVDTADLAALLVDIAAVSAEALEAVVEGAANAADRCLVMAGALRLGGAPDVAADLERYAATLVAVLPEPAAGATTH